MTKKVPCFQRISQLYQSVGMPSPTDDRLVVHHREEVMPQLVQKSPRHFRTSFYQLSFVRAALPPGLP